MKIESRGICTTATALISSHSKPSTRRRRQAPSSEAGRRRASHSPPPPSSRATASGAPGSSAARKATYNGGAASAVTTAGTAIRSAIPASLGPAVEVAEGLEVTLHRLPQANLGPGQVVLLGWIGAQIVQLEQLVLVQGLHQL